MEKFKKLGREEMKMVFGGKCQSTDNNPTAHCAPGDNGCEVQCFVTCTDSCGNTGAACSTYAVCD